MTVAQAAGPVIVARVVNDAGRAFNVRLVCRGDRYGLNDGLVCDEDEPIVEFWDATCEHDPRFMLGLGRFVARYYLGTLTGKEGYCGHDHRRIIRGFSLCGHESAWTVTGQNVTDAVAAAEAVLRGWTSLTWSFHAILRRENPENAPVVSFQPLRGEQTP